MRMRCQLLIIWSRCRFRRIEERPLGVFECMKGGEEITHLNHRYPLALGIAVIFFFLRRSVYGDVRTFCLHRIKDNLEVSRYEIYIYWN